MNSFKTFLLLLASSQLSRAAVIQGGASSGELIGRAGCGNPALAEDLSACYTYCDTSTSQINGPAIAASARIVCDVASCSDSKANSVSITEGFTVTAGLSTSPIQASSAFSWSKTVSSSDTYSFTLEKGDDGHIEFIPLLNQICGTLTDYEASVTSSGGYCTKTVAQTDTNACGTSGIKLDDGTASGTFTFCNTNGTGCNPFKSTGVSKELAL